MVLSLRADLLLLDGERLWKLGSECGSLLPQGVLRRCKGTVEVYMVFKGPLDGVEVEGSAIRSTGVLHCLTCFGGGVSPDDDVFEGFDRFCCCLGVAGDSFVPKVFRFRCLRNFLFCVLEEGNVCFKKPGFILVVSPDTAAKRSTACWFRFVGFITVAV